MTSSDIPQDGSPAFHIKGGSFTATVLELASVHPEQIKAQLAARTLDAAAWLQQSPVILNLDKVADQDADWAGLVALCREHGVAVVGLRAPKALQPALQRVGVPLLGSLRRKGGDGEPAGTAAVAPAAEAVAALAATPAAVRPETRIITTPVRGGQQIYAEGDLIVLAPVSAGAEVLADGHIHIYAPLRGRALAGVKGDATARIFCQSLEAELISIAGRYRVAEELRKAPEWGRPIQVVLQEDVLNLLPL